MKKHCLAYAACLWLAAAGTGAAALQPIAVLDFRAPPSGGGQWDWASGGLADLLQIELEHLGLVTLDRDFIRAVLAEQRLAADSLTAPDQIKLGTLLNARYLVGGNILPLEGGRIRVEATAFSVEAIETVVTAAKEGAYPKELPETIRSLARALAGKLEAPASQSTGSLPPSRATKPEALIMFYRGLNACSQGRPEIAVAWFMNASALDPEFAPPLLWEIKAYEMGGLEQLARLRREQTAPVLSRLGFKTVVLPTLQNHTDQPVLAVLPVAVSSANSAATPSLSAATATALRQAILGTGKARLFAYEGIGDALAEQDLQLSSLFTREGAPRYGRWLMSDALLLCHVGEQQPGGIAVNLALLDPLTTRVVVSVQRMGTSGSVARLVSSLTSQLLEDWLERKPLGSGHLAPPLAETALTEAETREMTPAYQALVLALNQVRRTPASGEAHAALANAFIGTGRVQEAGEEINRRLDALDIHAQNADLNYFAADRWLTENVGIARPWVDQAKFARLIDQLLAAFPNSLAAGCMHYSLAVDAWKSGKWREASEQAASARRILGALGYPYELERTLILAACFLEGASLLKLGELDEAERALLDGQSFLKRFELRAFALPLVPVLMEFNGSQRVAGYGGDRPDLKTGIQEQLGLLAQIRSGQTPWDYVREARARVAAEGKPRGRRQNWLGCAQELTGILERVPDHDEDQVQGVLSAVLTAVRLAAFRPGGGSGEDAALRAVAQRIVSVLLQKRGVASLAQAGSLPKARLLDLAGEINRVGSTAGLADEAAETLGPLFDAPCAPEFGLSVVLRIDASSDRLLQIINHLAGRLPGGESDVPPAVWIHVAQHLAEQSRYREALGCYRKAVAKGTAPVNCPGLSAALVQATLASVPARPNDEARRLCAEAGLPPFEPAWYEWFNAGHRCQQAKQYDKAIVCYRTVIDFLENPEQSGAYHLEKETGSDPISLRWGPSIGEVDLRWSHEYNARWYSSAFYLAQCLIEAGPKEEAARWLRRIAVSLGGDQVALLQEVTWSSANYTTEALGVRAAEMLKQLHEVTPTGAFGASSPGVPANAIQKKP
jgi:tetratricopeptide (TPR) repeat protein